MEKKILVAVDSSIYARHAIHYAARLAQQIDEMNFVLLHVQPAMSQYLVDEAMRRPQARAELNAVYQKNQTASFELLEKMKTAMVEQGVDPGAIETHSQVRNDGIAEDIQALAESRSYDGILIGRRGLGSLHELFMGSVTSTLLSRARLIPVWVVDGTVSTGSVLVAVDGSSHSLRAVDHVAFVFHGNRSVKFHFLHVQPILGDICEIDTESLETAELEEAILASDTKCISDFSAQAMGILTKAGIGEEQISFSSMSKKLSPGKTITDAMTKQKFGTIVIGKNSHPKRTSLGKVARHIVQKLSDGAVWVVP